MCALGLTGQSQTEINKNIRLFLTFLLNNAVFITWS